MGFKSRQSPGKQQAEFDNCTESSLEKYCSNWKLFFRNFCRKYSSDVSFPSIIFGESCSVSLAFGFLSLCT